MNLVFSRPIIMFFCMLSLITILLFTSCTRSNFELIVKNESEESIYLVYSEKDSVIDNHWLTEYLKKYYISMNDTFTNIKETIKPRGFIKFRDLPIRSTPKYKLFIYIIKSDTILSSGIQTIDSNLICKMLLKRYVVTTSDFKSNTLEIVYK